MALILGLVSCEDFLTPKDKSNILEENLFKDREGAEEAVYGLYTQLSKEGLYGTRIPFIMDLYGQYSKRHVPEGYVDAWPNVYLHENNTDFVKGIFEPLWKDLYVSVGYVNSLIKNLENWTGKPLKYLDLYKGECYGLRAFIHFDLLRMFGSPDLNKRGIPYVTEYGAWVTKFSTTKDYYTKIIADLKLAESLL